SNLAKALGADGVEPRVGLVDEIHLEAADIGVHRHLVFGDVVVEEAAKAIVDLALLAERGADAPDQSAVDLTRRRSPADHAPAVDHGDDARDPRPRNARVNADFDEMR